MSVNPRIWLRRAYDPPTRNDGYRVLVDRVWPRGVSREELHIDEWLREIAPSDDLRKWFGHERDRWEEFRSRYRAELDKHPDLVDGLVERVGRGRVTLVFGARDEERNQAVVIRDALLDRMA